MDAQTKTFEAGFTGPEGHYISRPAIIEVPWTLHGQSLGLHCTAECLHGRTACMQCDRGALTGAC